MIKMDLKKIYDTLCFRYEVRLCDYDKSNAMFHNDIDFRWLESQKDGIRLLETDINSIADEFGLERIEAADLSPKGSRERKREDDAAMERFFRSRHKKD